jgi:hypothetical protein
MCRHMLTVRWRNSPCPCRLPSTLQPEIPHRCAGGLPWSNSRCGSLTARSQVSFRHPRNGGHSPRVPSRGVLRMPHKEDDGTSGRSNAEGKTVLDRSLRLGGRSCSRQEAGAAGSRITTAARTASTLQARSMPVGSTCTQHAELERRLPMLHFPAGQRG